MIVFRQCDPRYPFLWEDAGQPAGRWHGRGDGPVQYFADTPTGAWAEFLRHEEIREPAELAGVRRALWAVELPEPPKDEPELAERLLLGGTDTYPECQTEARRLRARGAAGLKAPSAALRRDGATGWRVDGGLRPAVARAATVYALFGPRPLLVGWPAVTKGSPPEEVLTRVRHFPW